MKTKYIIYELTYTLDPAFAREDLKLWSRGYVRLPDRGEFAVYKWEG